MSTRTERLLHWTPRILAILYALFISMFAMDVWDMDGTVLERIGGFLIHLVPTYMVLGLLAVGWFRPTIGGVLFILLALAFTMFFNWTRDWPTLLILGLPLIIIGALFLWDGRHEQQEPRPVLHS